jgi:hypothetical protein
VSHKLVASFEVSGAHCGDVPLSQAALRERERFTSTGVIKTHWELAAAAVDCICPSKLNYAAGLAGGYGKKGTRRSNGHATHGR